MTVSRSCFVSSTPLLDAASISWKSIKLPSEIDKHVGHFPQGLESSPSSQLRLLANILAIVVFPTPLVPLKTNA